MSQIEARITDEIASDSPLRLEGRRLHFVGIGGCGMSGLAKICRALGAQCGGTDFAASPWTDALTDAGIPVTLRQAVDTVPDPCDLVVASAAIKPDHPEIVAARERGLPVLKYAQLLGRLMLGRLGVAIAGTHGKSTTTAMLAHALIQSECDPTFIVGATCDQIGGGARAGRPDMLIGEACEYDRSFHNFHPTHGIILNVEEDHLDVYHSIDAIVDAFHDFARRISPDGSLLIGHEDAHRTAVAAGLDCPTETIGFAPQADWQIILDRPAADAAAQAASNPSPPQGERPAEGVSDEGATGRSPTSAASPDIASPPHQRVTIRHDGRDVCHFACQLPGDHMAYNAAVAAVTAHRLGAAWEAIGRALSDFRGLDRRMQALGAHHGVTVIDDYGHHPTEIDTTLRALRDHHRPEQRGGRLLCVFQPHQHSRTRFLLDQFAASFSQADVVIVPHIYFVRDSETDRRAVSAADLAHKLQQQGVLAVHINDFDDITHFLRQHCRPNDLLVVMGAGPVWQVAHKFIQT